jgi:hypothetical protein
MRHHDPQNRFASRVLSTSAAIAKARSSRTLGHNQNGCPRMQGRSDCAGMTHKIANQIAIAKAR